MRNYPIRRLTFDTILNPLEKTNIELSGGSRPRLYLQYGRTKRKVLLKTYSHNPHEIYSEYLASRLAEKAGIRAQAAIFKVIPDNIAQWMKDESNNSLADDWYPIGIEISNIFPDGVEVAYGKDILGDPERRLTLSAVEDGLSARFAEPEDLLQSYSDMVVFDAFIGNMDRHHENWGVVMTSKYKRGIIQPSLFGADELANERYFTPLFDHGSSLMFELPNEKLAKMNEDIALVNRYVSKGYGFILDEKSTKGNIFDIIGQYIESSPEWRARFVESIHKIISREVSEYGSVIERMPIKDEWGWTSERRHALFIMLTVRYNRLKKLIEFEL